jgi:two-component system, OmpR family, sensor histidine kinase ChvG
VTLRRQLLLVSLLLLSLPWAGCQFVREIEGALRQGQEQSLRATARAVATLMRDRPQLLYPDVQRAQPVQEKEIRLYAPPARQPIIVDGYAEGWAEQGYRSFSGPAGDQAFQVSYQAATGNGQLYLLLQVRDPQLVYHNPGISSEANGDRLVLRTWRGGARQDYVIATSAPGEVRGRFASARQRGASAARIRGYWQDTAQGYTLELEMPLDVATQRLGFYIVNASKGKATATAGNTSPMDISAPPWLITHPHELQRILAPFGAAGDRLQVVDGEHWVVGEPALSPASGNAAQQTETFWLLKVLYRSILNQPALTQRPTAEEFGKLSGSEVDLALSGQMASQLYSEAAGEGDNGRTLSSAAAPVYHGDKVIGSVVASAGSEQYLSLTDQAFSRLFGYSLGALSVAGLGLLGYASLLSWRISRLSRASQQAIDERGQVRENFPRSRAPDEIGELSRNYASLLDEVREYNNYLGTLSSKLSHELRTPIAVIRGSLENLEQSPDTADSQIYLKRARYGLKRLTKILTAMSEARRLEESISAYPLQKIDLVTLLKDVHAGYQDSDRKHRLTLQLSDQIALINTAPELVVQALDKLIANAMSFCPEGKPIEIRLDRRPNHYEITVSNEGPLLPEELGSRVFDPMVSLRDKNTPGVHLGLGLHIVRLIAGFLGGSASARNKPAQNGVEFTLSLPASSPPS